MSDIVLKRIKQRLEMLYLDTELVETAYTDLLAVLNQMGIQQSDATEKWSQEDFVLITYGDSFVEEATAPLKTLDKFLKKYVKDALNTVHILPFFPYSSDDGFSVIDYTMVDPDLGDWEDVSLINESYELMYDLVINHASRESLWFTDYKANIEPFNEFFIELDGGADVSAVTRPRNTPLLVPAYTHRGRKMVWATFSADQVDLNFKNPKVLIKMIEVLLLYIKNGARIVRLDAIAFFWKKLGTQCIHLPETHEAVKLIRDVMELAAPKSIVLTETNVPHAENLSYFGQLSEQSGLYDEAHLVYQFALPPLILHALYRADGSYLTDWAMNLETPPPGCSYLNFTASHDGVGVRPVEKILPKREVDDLITSMHRLGGFVSNKSNPDGTESPYEINIALFSAFREIHSSIGPDQWQVNRFICSQMIMMSLQGIPAIYVHSLIATPNDREGVEKTGRTRSINRKKWDFDYLEALIESGRTSNAEVLERLTAIMKIRKKHKAFHPDTPQQVLNLGSDYFALWRAGSDVNFPLLAIHNLTNEIKMLDVSTIEGFDVCELWVEVLEGNLVKSTETSLLLQPYQAVWMVPEAVEGVSSRWAMHID